jgi:peptide/nickel transport system ATP-binding protein
MLIGSVPRIGDKGNRQKPAVGEVPSAMNPPAGCHFHPRCPYAQDRCRTEVPALRAMGDGRMARCHFAETLTLAGMDGPGAGA